jgi:hypothetical protein
VYFAGSEALNKISDLLKTDLSHLPTAFSGEALVIENISSPVAKVQNTLKVELHFLQV